MIYAREREGGRESDERRIVRQKSNCMSQSASPVTFRVILHCTVSLPRTLDLSPHIIFIEIKSYKFVHKQ